IYGDWCFNHCGHWSFWLVKAAFKRFRPKIKDQSMKTVILKTASSYLLPVLLLFSIFILLRGHYLPGGGFVGGLIASIAFVLHSFANGLMNTKTLFKFHPGLLMPIGLALAFLSGVAPLLFGLPFMTGLWYPE